MYKKRNENSNGINRWMMTQGRHFVESWRAFLLNGFSCE